MKYISIIIGIKSQDGLNIEHDFLSNFQQTVQFSRFLFPNIVNVVSCHMTVI